MRIISMTATFGKLENRTLELEPGLNLICAPNEWGKSTWCAFLTVMLYGLDTRAKTTRTVLAEKERYAPWSGAPMSGRIRLEWQGRDITVERRAKGRTPMGEFTAYETQTGLAVQELRADNCGQVLLGVERSVFQRSGFIQLSDMPVTQDEALRRRLNDLVTTGDENSGGQDLAQKLKELKNKCRYNRSGLLPQAELQQRELEEKLRELEMLQEQCRRSRQRQQELEEFGKLLENHKAALEYGEAQTRVRRMEEAAEACDRALRELEDIQHQCEDLPEAEMARQKEKQGQMLQQRQLALEMDGHMLPPIPRPPQVNPHYPDPAQAEAAAAEDLRRLEALEKSKKKNGLILGIYAGAAAVLLALLLVPAVRQLMWLVGAAVVLAGVASFGVCMLRTKKILTAADAICICYPGIPAQKWEEAARAYGESWREYSTLLQMYQEQTDQWNRQKALLEEEIRGYTDGAGLQETVQIYTQAIQLQMRLGEARREYQRTVQFAEGLRAGTKPLPPPSGPDAMTYSMTDTLRMLSDNQFEMRQLHTRLGQYQGKMEALGSREQLQLELDGVQARIRRLNQVNGALELALDTLAEVSAQLQRRFAPRIANQARDIFGAVTGGKYDRLILSEDLTVSTGAGEENTLRTAQWRSDGTMDQMYLALRLAVARELTPQAPLVLDDAFARFDDVRLQAAMELLKTESVHRQVILFSCQNREKDYV